MSNPFDVQIAWEKDVILKNLSDILDDVKKEQIEHDNKNSTITTSEHDVKKEFNFPSNYESLLSYGINNLIVTYEKDCKPSEYDNGISIKKSWFTDFGGKIVSNYQVGGNFPNYKRVMPENTMENSLVLKRADIVKAYEFCKVYNKKNMRAYILNDLSYQGSKCGDKNPDNALIAIRSTFIYDLIRHDKSINEITIEYTNPKQALKIMNGKMTQIIMPMQID